MFVHLFVCACVYIHYYVLAKFMPTQFGQMRFRDAPNHNRIECSSQIASSS